MTIFAAVVTFNRLSDLKICINSLRQQTKKLDGIIVVNNNSTDGTLHWLESQEDLTVILQENLGSGGGSRRALQEAVKRGADLIYLLDDDCIALPNALELLFAARDSLNDPDQWVLTSLATDPRTGQIGPITLATEKIPRITGKMVFNLKDVPEEYTRESIILNWGHFFIGTLLPVKIIDSIGYPRAEYFIRGEDYEYLLRCLRQYRVGIATKSIMMHPMDVRLKSKKRKLDWKEYCQLRNHMAINREYFPNIKNSPIFRLLKYAKALVHDFVYLRSWDRLLYYAYLDAVTKNFRRDIAALRKM